MAVVLLISLYTTRAVLNVLGVENYGIYNVVCGFVSMFSFLNTSMSNGIQRFHNFELGRNGTPGAEKVFNTALFIQLILAIIVVLLAETLGTWYLCEKMVIPEARLFAAKWIFHLSVVSFAFVILQAPFSAAVMAHEKMDFYAIVNISDAVLKLLITFVIPLFSFDGLILYGILICLINVLDFLLYLLYSRINFAEIRVKFCFEANMFKSMVGFSGWNVLGTFANMMKEQGINVVMNLFFGPVVNAARGIAFQVNSGLQSLVQNIMVPVRPQLVQSYAAGDLARTLRLMYSASKLSCFFLLIFSYPLILEIDTILDLWLGSNVPEHAGVFVIIIVLTSYLNNLNAAVSNVVHATGKMKLYQLTGSCCILLAVPLAYISLKMGAAPEVALMMSLLSMFVAQVVALVVLKTIIDFSIHYYLKNVIKPIITVVFASIVLPVIAHFVLEAGFVRLLAVTIASCFSCVLSIYCFGLNESERSLLIGMVKNKMTR